MTAKTWLALIASVILWEAAGAVDAESPPGTKPVAETIPPAPGPFQPTWESLGKYQVPAWFRDGKFGIFVHWGPQTLAGSDAAGDGTKTRNWKELAAAFEGQKFDAQAWATAFKKSGAQYVVQVVEHHDGYALYDSSLTSWSSVKMGPQRDFAAELSAAVRAAGLIYGASSHTEENWWFYSEPPKKLPRLPKPGEPFVGEQPPQEWLDNWYARLVEIVEKYDPTIFWFDWSIEQPAYEPYLRKFAAYYYNRVAARNQGVVLNYKYEAFPTKAAVLDVSVNTSRFSWSPEGIRSTPWQFDTWSAQDRVSSMCHFVIRQIARSRSVAVKTTMLALCLIPVVSGAGSAAEPSLVPDTPSTAPDYFCTWNLQGFCCSHSSPDQMTAPSSGAFKELDVRLP